MPKPCAAARVATSASLPAAYLQATEVQSSPLSRASFTREGDAKAQAINVIAEAQVIVILRPRLSRTVSRGLAKAVYTSLQLLLTSATKRWCPGPT
eukprot:16913-Heterococcus_DN1.PRE.3